MQNRQNAAYFAIACVGFPLTLEEIQSVLFFFKEKKKSALVPRC
jgi:hypothetical protein